MLIHPSLTLLFLYIRFSSRAQEGEVSPKIKRKKFVILIDMKDIINQIHQKLKTKAKPLSPKNLEKARQFMGPEFQSYGINMAEVYKIIKKIYLEHENSLDLSKAYQISEELIKSPIFDEKTAAFSFIAHFQKDFNEDTLRIFRKWFEKYVNNWGTCDSFCLKVIGPFLKDNPELVPKLEDWSKSKNLWVKRASLVGVLKISRYLKPNYILKRAEPFMETKEPFLQKAVGWLLKESSKWHKKEVVDFLLKWKKKTSRLVLRYATEKVDQKTREKVLKR